MLSTIYLTRKCLFQSDLCYTYSPVPLPQGDLHFFWNPSLLYLRKLKYDIYRLKWKDKLTDQAQVAQTMDSAIHRKNHYLVDKH